MRSSDLSRAAWRTSSRSNDGGNGNCVEVAELADWVALRDSKDPAGAVLALSCGQWRVFVVGIRADQFT